MNYMEQLAQMLGVELEQEFCIKGNDYKYKITKYGMCVFSEFSAVWDFANDILVGILTDHYEIEKYILTNKEKEYLRNFINIFEITSVSVQKEKYPFDDGYERLNIKYVNKLGHIYEISTPIFKKDTNYKGMEPNKEYTLEELGL